MKALLNRHISDVSTDLMLRVLSALGYKNNKSGLIKLNCFFLIFSKSF